MPDSSAKSIKSLSLSQLFNMGFGTIIGVGWITVYGDLLSSAGSIGVAAAFLLGGLMVCLVGFCYAELGGLYRVSGGEIVYAYAAFGPKAAFVAAWLLLYSLIAVIAFEAISVVWILSYFAPHVDGPVLYDAFGQPVRAGTVILGIGGTVFLGWLNARGALLAARLQTFLTYALIAISATFVIVALANGRMENLSPLIGPYDTYGAAMAGFFSVLITTPFFFAGFNVISQAMGETAESCGSGRVGKVILLSIGGAALFYSLVFISASVVLPRQEVLALPLPAAGAFAAAFQSKIGGDLVLLGGLLGLLTTWNAMIFSAARVLQTMGRAGFLSPFFAAMHPRAHSPHHGIWVAVFLSAFLVLLGRGAILPIVNSVATYFSVLFMMVALSFLVLRKKNPNAPRPFKVRRASVVGIGAILLSFAMISLSLYQQKAESSAQLPLEWLLLGLWSVLGGIILFRKRPTFDALARDPARALVKVENAQPE